MLAHSLRCPHLQHGLDGRGLAARYGSAALLRKHRLLRLRVRSAWCTASGPQGVGPQQAHASLAIGESRPVLLPCSHFRWLTSLVIIGLYWANGGVFDSPQWRVYGAQAIILHSNQLVVPLLVGMWWRPVMNAVVAGTGKSGKAVETDPESMP